jgi:hypothetical protein
MNAKSMIALGLLSLSAVGCSGATGTGASPTAAIFPPGADFVTQVNTLCVALVEDYLEATNPHPGSFPIEEYIAEKAKVQPLIDAFDAMVDSIPRTENDRPAADAFDAFRGASDEADAELAAAAATGDQEVFDAAVDERHRALFDSPERQQLEEVGINCDAR